MDQDGANHRFLTNGQSSVLPPRCAPSQQTLVYMSYAGNRPRIYVDNIGTGSQKLVANLPNMTFAPRFSPDGRHVIFSMARSEEHTSELQSLMRISYAVFCLKKKKPTNRE